MFQGKVHAGKRHNSWHLQVMARYKIRIYAYNFTPDGRIYDNEGFPCLAKIGNHAERANPHSSISYDESILSIVLYTDTILVTRLLSLCSYIGEEYLDPVAIGARLA